MMKNRSRALLAFGLALAATAVLVLWYFGAFNSDRDSGPNAPTPAETPLAEIPVPVRPAPPPPVEARYVGLGQCQGCHEEETRRWRGSDHDLAMQEASPQTVLGDFDDATFTQHGVTSTFTREGDTFRVRTEGPDGKLHDYEVAHVFGVRPLQQYLIAFPGGRYQVLPLCWDTRPKEDGGRRWFHIYDQERIPPHDALFWAGPNQNWNYMCAECHSTNLQKNYDVKENRYATSWSEINVSCEACHGPGSDHVAWARAVERGEEPADAKHMGLTVRLKDRDQDIWIYDKETGNARRRTPRNSTVLVEMCARCHARRGVVSEDYVHGRPFADTHTVRLLNDALYFPDGQIKDEVYVLGSFLQSKMYHHGVHCSDCHDPHSLKQRAPGNEVCHRCHLAARFDTPYHHHHEAGTKGASCAECHMPERTYMVVDPRRDHSIRIPRPDLTEKTGAPNACNRCHTDQTPAWSVKAMDEWYGAKWRAKTHWAETIHAGRRGSPDAAGRLVALVFDAAAPAIVRATAVSMLRRRAGAHTLRAVAHALRDSDPVVRRAGLDALEGFPPADRLRLGLPRLGDPVRSVRCAAVPLLVSIPPSMMTAPQRAAVLTGVEEYEASELSNGDRGAAHLNLGVLYTNLREPRKAEEAYRTAIRIEPGFAQAYVNLADLYRAEGRDKEGEQVLRRAVAHDPGLAEAHHALGLLLVRSGRTREATHALERAARLRPSDPRFGYVYAVAIESQGKLDLAVDVLERVHGHHPEDRPVLIALVAYHRKNGRLDRAIRFSEKLLALDPQDSAARRNLSQLRREAAMRR